MTGATKTSIAVEAIAPVPEQHQKLLSTLRLKVLLSVPLVLLLIAVLGLVFYLVSDIFGRLTPDIREDLHWKAQRGAAELAQTSDLAMAIGDKALVEKSFAAFRDTPDVLALVAVDAKGSVIASHGRPPGDLSTLFRGKSGNIHTSDGQVSSWSEATIEGNPVGRMAVVLSTGRLEAGERLRRNILATAGVGCVLALGLSLLFVNFRLVPLINLTQQGLRTAREMEIAKRIQTSILPRQLGVDTLEISATMIPATEVGGDYYDVIPAEKGCWIGVGDVAGHGLQAGLIMMMVQSVVSALTRRLPDASPRTLLDTLNRVLYDNIRHRLRSDEHVTFCLLRYLPDGQITYAGGHEEILVCRAATGKCERVPTPGPWVGAVKNVQSAAVDSQLRLEPGDVMVLHTDGVTEAKNASGEQFGLERLIAEVEKSRKLPTEQIRARLLLAVKSWMAEQDDDVTLMVLRQK